MKKEKIFRFAMGLALAAAVSVQAEEKSWSGNQLQSGSVPKTQRPADEVGGVSGVKAPSGASLLVLQKGSVLYLKGDSTLHKFEMGGKALQGSAVVKGDLSALKGDSVASMTLSVPVEKLKSKEKGLDENAYKALHAKDHPTIAFALDSLTLAAPKDGAQAMTAKGKLTINGVTQAVTLTGTVKLDGKKVHVAGSYKLKMSDFQVKPPSISILVTSINVMDEVEVVFDLILGS